ncbi:MAG: AAA family ATPase, partial [Betaproteobacteria bacterium]|nr:AAA family ATPase [Betaproteobacteria bacterium]
ASNNGVDAVREIRENAKYLPASGARKIYIIDEVHMLTTAAFNALLKTIEEPPPHVIFVFATTEPHKIPSTILSRCQRFDLRRVTAAQVQTRLAEVITSEKIEFEPGALALIAPVRNNRWVGSPGTLPTRLGRPQNLCHSLENCSAPLLVGWAQADGNGLRRVPRGLVFCPEKPGCRRTEAERRPDQLARHMRESEGAYACISSPND